FALQLRQKGLPQERKLCTVIPTGITSRPPAATSALVSGSIVALAALDLATGTSRSSQSPTEESEVLALLRQRAGSPFGPVEAVACLWRLGRAASHTASAAARLSKNSEVVALLEQVGQFAQARRLGPRELSNALAAAARLCHAPGLRELDDM
ncbi:unnamed protein product, partial [Polarella glacialis]